MHVLSKYVFKVGKLVNNKSLIPKERKLTQAEINILLALVDKDRTAYQLHKENKVAGSNKTVFEALKNLEDMGLIRPLKPDEIGERKDKRQRKPYRITPGGVYACFATPRITLGNYIDRIAKNHPDALLAFRKWDYLVEKGLREIVIGRFGLVLAELKSTEIKETIFSKLMGWTNETQSFASEKNLKGLRNIIDQMVLGGGGFIFNPRIHSGKFIEEQTKIFQAAKADPELRDFINLRFEDAKRWIKTMKEGIQEWEALWQTL